MALFLFALLPGLALADTPVLLEKALENWTAGKQEVAFTQRVRTFDDDGKIKEERIERYDPSLPDDQRWHLIEVNGGSPTEAQRKALEQRKNRKPRKAANKSPGDILDFPHATVVSASPKAVVYEVALRPEAARLVQTENLVLLITVDRENAVIERATANLLHPIRVALGLAKITDVDLDLTFDLSDDPVEAGTEGSQPSGTARVALFRLGARMEYEWWGFKRVDGYPRDEGQRGN